MSTNKILTVVFALVAAGLAFYLYYSINSSIERTERIASLEAKVIDQLKLIREAETAYMAVNGQYTSDWERLIAFVDTGKIFITETTETIITLEYGADSTHTEIDTIGTVLVRDSIFNQAKYPNFVAQDLPYVPGRDKKVKFDVWADKIDKSGVMVNVIEVKNPRPFDPERKEDSDRNNRKPLRFGSRTSVTTSGNWE